MNAYEKLQQDLKAQEEKIKASNELWKKDLEVLRRKYWKDPKIREAILDATESIKQTES